MDQSRLVPISNIFDANQVRNIRNDCRLFMTNNTSRLSLISQILWYFTRYRPENKKGNLKCFLYKINNKNQGFALISINDGKSWITGGLREAIRGQGFGKDLFRKIIAECNTQEIWLEVLDSNEIAKHIYKEVLRFEKVKEVEINGNKVLVMKLSK